MTISRKRFAIYAEILFQWKYFLVLIHSLKITQKQNNNRLETSRKFN